MVKIGESEATVHGQCENKNKTCKNAANRLALKVVTHHKLTAFDAWRNAITSQQKVDHPMSLTLNHVIAEQFNKSMPV